ncbi:hypothetical protein MMC34_008166 [Xylographa carneopallida]|nr:hypothetical protein [Xylographa carneopallida]
MPPSSTPSPSLRKQYLTFYNALSALLWTILLLRVLILLPLAGHRQIHTHVGQSAKWTQTLAVLEILHSAFGIVRSPILTTSIQVSSRLLLVWGIVATYPAATGPSPFYTSMLLAWAVTEVIRYSYFVANLRVDSSGAEGQEVPRWLVWLRYNTFYVLYPVGIGSEMTCVWLASQAAGTRAVRLLLWDVLVVYVPAGYVMYTHMMKQRRKVMRGKQPERRRGN